MLCLLTLLDLKLTLAPGSDENCRPLLISLGVRWMSALGSAKGTQTLPRVRHCRYISFFLMPQCMDEIRCGRMG